MKLHYPLLLILITACTAVPDSTDKTLVSWVEIYDGDVKGGTILTIQYGEQFDGIILADQDETVWIAGSNDDERTRKEAGPTSQQSSGPEGLKQIPVQFTGCLSTEHLLTLHTAVYITKKII